MAIVPDLPGLRPQGGDPEESTPARARTSRPPLAWSGLPNGTKSVALIVDDPDAPDPAAPKRVWVHWVLYNLPPIATGLAGSASAHHAAGRHARGQERLGPHRLRRAVPADRAAPLFPQALRARRRAAGPEAADEGAVLLEAMEGHVLEEAELIGTYQKN